MKYGYILYELKKNKEMLWESIKIISLFKVYYEVEPHEVGKKL